MISVKVLILLAFALTYFTLDASVKGKFTAPPSCPEVKQNIIVIPEETKQKLRVQRSEVIEQQSINSELHSRIQELEGQLQEALDTIGSLTGDFQKCQRQNDLLRKELKKSLENLEFTKKQYSICESKLGHQYLKNQYCKMKQQPNLLR